MTIMLSLHQRHGDLDCRVLNHTYMETTRFTKPGSRRSLHWSSGVSIAAGVPGVAAGRQRSVEMGARRPRELVRVFPQSRDGSSELEEHPELVVGKKTTR